MPKQHPSPGRKTLWNSVAHWILCGNSPVTWPQRNQQVCIGCGKVRRYAIGKLGIIRGSWKPVGRVPAS